MGTVTELATHPLSRLHSDVCACGKVDPLPYVGIKTKFSLQGRGIVRDRMSAEPTFAVLMMLALADNPVEA